MERDDLKTRHLRIFENKSEYHAEREGDIDTFEEGRISNNAKERMKTVKDALHAGYFEDLIVGIANGSDQADPRKITQIAQESISGLVDSLTSEVGRALIGLSVMQLCIKAIAPEQDIRLHKGSGNSSAFSWQEGISMRTLDSGYITPILRKHELLRLNADGFMMTRSLAENYPYTPLYKARLRGAREEWLNLVDDIQSMSSDPRESLKLLISKLHNSATNFQVAVEELLAVAKSSLGANATKEVIKTLIKTHIDESNYAARLLEVAMHSLFQSLLELGTLGSFELKPLSQMRSANKKHGNIGDVELLENNEIVESWDAKYGKGYLREELEELSEKISDHESVQKVGFVTTVSTERQKEISHRIDEIEQLYGIEILIVSFDDWVNDAFERGMEGDLVSESKLAERWVNNYCFYLGQKMRDQAPIDEPCSEWVTSLRDLIKS